MLAKPNFLKNDRRGILPQYMKLHIKVPQHICMEVKSNLLHI